MGRPCGNSGLTNAKEHLTSSEEFSGAVSSEHWKASCILALCITAAPLQKSWMIGKVRIGCDRSQIDYSDQCNLQFTMFPKLADGQNGLYVLNYDRKATRSS